MISNRLLQESLEDFKEIVRLPMAFYDRNCTCVAGAENMAPEKEVFQTFCNSSADMQALGNRYLFRVGDGESGYILSVSGKTGGSSAGENPGDRLQQRRPESVHS